MSGEKTSPTNLGLDSELARSWTLPAKLYFDPRTFELEQRELFSRTWQIVGRREQLANPGDYFTTELAGEPLLLVRDQDRQLRGFFNVCRHRAGPPAEACGNRKVFRCIYHGWTYSLDGKLLNCPEMEGVQDFSQPQFGLRPVQAEEWGAWIFVNLAPQAEAFPSLMRDVMRQAAKFPLDGQRLYERREYLMNCNWKAAVDNYLEGYHLPSIHPALNREVDYGEYKTELFQWHSRQTAPVRGAENESTSNRRYSPELKGQMVEYFWIFPNWMLNCYPDNVSLNLMVPVAPEKTLAIFEWYSLTGKGDENAAKAVEFSDQIQKEDMDICEKVQRNLKSRAYDRGRFSVKQEKGVHHFQELYAKWTENAFREERRP